MTIKDVTEFKMTRDEAIAAGLLLDVSDEASQVGFVWPVAITEELELELQRHLPPQLTTPTTRAEMEILTHALSASVMDLLRIGVERLHAADENSKESSFVFPYMAATKEGVFLQVRLSVGGDADGKGCFTLSLEQGDA